MIYRLPERCFQPDPFHGIQLAEENTVLYMISIIIHDLKDISQAFFITDILCYKKSSSAHRVTIEGYFPICPHTRRAIKRACTRITLRQLRR